MKRGSYLINTARGKICDASAVAKACEEGHLAGESRRVGQNRLGRRFKFGCWLSTFHTKRVHSKRPHTVHPSLVLLGGRGGTLVSFLHQGKALLLRSPFRLRRGRVVPSAGAQRPRLAPDAKQRHDAPRLGHLLVGAGTLCRRRGRGGGCVGGVAGGWWVGGLVVNLFNKPFKGEPKGVCLDLLLLCSTTNPWSSFLGSWVV